MKIAIVGSGNVGAALGTALILNRHDVLFYDIVSKDLPIPARFTVDFDEAFDHAEGMFICVPTELAADGKTCDLSILYSVCYQFAERVRPDDRKRILIQKSTCPPGTAQTVTGWIEAEYGIRNGVDYDYVVNPSFLNMSTPIRDEMLQRKCLAGLNDPDDLGAEIAERMRRLYHWAEPLFASYAAVELAKYANNVMHAGILSIWNELFLLGQKLDVDTDWVARVTVLEPGLESVYRIHGMAWGGVCLPKDTKALLTHAEELGVDMRLLESIVEVNEVMAERYGVRKQHWSDLHKPSATLPKGPKPNDPSA